MEASFPLRANIIDMDFNVCSTMTRLCHSSALTIPQRISCAFAIPCNRHRFCCTFPFKDHRCISGHVTKNMQRKTRAFPEKEGGLAQAHCFTVVQNSEEEAELTSSSMAIAMAIRRASASPVEFVQRMEKVARGVFSCPSADFRTLCNEQLALCGNLVGEDILLSVYIRPAESYGTDQLELRRAACYPGQDLTEPDDTLVLIGTFGTQKGLRSVEIALVERPAEEFPEHNAMVLPLVKDLFLVGLLVAIRPPAKDVEPSSLPAGMKSENDAYNALFTLFTAEQRSEAVKIAHSLALAYVMDQRALLFQKTSWQRGVKMSNLMEQIRSPLSNIRTLSKMLLPHLQRSEIPYDILEDILVQGEHMKDILQQLQDSFYYTKANLMHHHEKDLSKVQQGHLSFAPMETATAQALDLFSNQGNVSSNYKNNGETNATVFVGSHATMDLELPMPPLALAALQQTNTRPCNVSRLLSELVSAGYNLAQKQQQTLQLRDNTQLLQAAIEESALRQALSNLLDSALLRIPAGGWVKIEAMEAPGGGVLVVIDDNGPDMSFLTQTRSLAPFGPILSTEVRDQDNITWNFVAGITIAREILEHYGGVLRVLSPYLPSALLGAGGTRIEIWLPAASLDGRK